MFFSGLQSINREKGTIKMKMKNPSTKRPHISVVEDQRKKCMEEAGKTDVEVTKQAVQNKHPFYASSGESDSEDEGDEVSGELESDKENLEMGDEGGEDGEDVPGTVKNDQKSKKEKRTLC